MVTGAGGFTGAALARRLIGLRGQAGYFGNITSLVLVDRKLASAPDAPSVRIVEGDITERPVQGEAIGSGIDPLSATVIRVTSAMVAIFTAPVAGSARR